MTLRTRLTLWYALALTVVMALSAVGVLFILEHRSAAETARMLREDHEEAERCLVSVALVGVVWKEGVPHPGEEGWEGERGVEVTTPDNGALVHRSKGFQRGPGYDTYSAVCRVSSRNVVVEVSRSQKRVREELLRILQALLLHIPIGVGLAALAGYWLAGRALAPVGRMAERARTITADRLSDRLPVDNPKDEVGRLATVFNETLARLETSFEQMRRFTADASHELRTPLTAMRTVGEVGLREPRDAAAYREIVGSMLEEVDRLTRLVESLLTLSRADAGQVRLAPTRFDLGELAREAAAHLAVLAEEKGQAVTVEAPAPVPVEADRTVLRIAVVNLLDNAVKHSPAGTPVRVAVASRDGAAVLEVADRGPGIPPEHRERIFDRFYRVDESRSREQGGAGLGLALARWAAEAHGGRIELDSEAGKGSTFRIVLPPAGRTGGGVS